MSERTRYVGADSFEAGHSEGRREQSERLDKLEAENRELKKKAWRVVDDIHTGVDRRWLDKSLNDLMALLEARPDDGEEKGRPEMPPPSGYYENAEGEQVPYWLMSEVESKQPDS